VGGATSDDPAIDPCASRFKFQTAKEIVIARSKATKQSNFLFRGVRHGLLRSARNDVAPIPNARPHSRDANAPEPCMNDARPKKVAQRRARGMPGARCTRSLACEKKQSTRASSPKVQPRSPGIPHAMVLTAYFVLSPVTGLSCHRRYRRNNPCET
jgi:hypothetical protein